MRCAFWVTIRAAHGSGGSFAMAIRPPTPRDGAVYALGSALISSLIAAAAGTVYGLPTGTLLAMVGLAALGAGYFGYKSRMKGE